MRKELETMIFDEMRCLREVLAEVVADLDTAITGKFPEDLSDDLIVKQLQILRKLRAAPLIAQINLFTMTQGAMMNFDAMVDRARKAMDG